MDASEASAVAARVRFEARWAEAYGPAIEQAAGRGENEVRIVVFREDESFLRGKGYEVGPRSIRWPRDPSRVGS